MIEAKTVITALKEANTPAQKGAATRLLGRYVNQREKEGKDPARVRAAIKAVMNRN